MKRKKGKRSEYPFLQKRYTNGQWKHLRRCTASTDLRSVQSLSRVCLCDPMDSSTPGFPVHHQLLERAQTHVHRVSDAIHPSHPLSSPSPLVFNLSQSQGLFQGVSSLHQVAKVLGLQLQHQSFQWMDWFPLGWTRWISLLSKGSSRVFSNISSLALTFFIIQISHPYMTTEPTGKSLKTM